LTVRKWRQCKIVNLVPYLITFRNIKRYPLVAFLTSLFSSSLQLHELCPRNMEIVITFSASSSNATCAPYPKMKSFHFAELRIEPISRYSSYPCYAILLTCKCSHSCLASREIIQETNANLKVMRKSKSPVFGLPGCGIMGFIPCFDLEPRAEEEVQDAWEPTPYSAEPPDEASGDKAFYLQQNPSTI
jgi:hypothetical protein